MNKISYPGITICSQGIIQEVISNALKKQRIDYVNKTFGKNYSALSAQDQKALDLNFTQTLYPGSENSPQSIINVLTAPDPVETIKSQVYTNPGVTIASACSNSTTTCSAPWVTPTQTLANSSYNFTCLANFGKGKPKENKCESNGGEKIHFEELAWGKDAAAFKFTLTDGNYLNLNTTFIHASYVGVNQILQQLSHRSCFEKRFHSFEGYTNFIISSFC